MFDFTLSSVISVNTDTETIHFYSMTDRHRNTIRHDIESYCAHPFDEEFFTKLQGIVKRYIEKFPQFKGQKVAIVLPDMAFLTDTVNVPIVRKHPLNNSLNLAVNSIYKNSSELEFKSFPISQSKQFATYNILGLSKTLIAKFNNLCDVNRLSVETITYAANSAVNGAIALNSKLKNGTFVLLDIKDNFARFSLVVKGRTVGYYSLPFGYSMLCGSHIVSEDLLFDHSPGELLVANAKKKARSKQPITDEDPLFAEGSDLHGDEYGSDINEEEQDELPVTLNESSVTQYDAKAAFCPKKTARRLPRSMTRPTPGSKEGFICENFRIFVKWTLDLISNNQGIFTTGVPNTVYVNMPSEYGCVYDAVNADIKDNKVLFLPLASVADANELILKDLELFGAFYVNQYNKLNNFG